MNIHGIELNFDITSPEDVARYQAAGEAMEAAAADLAAREIQPAAPDFLTQYIALLNEQLCLFGNFIDAVFGDGVANQLLGDNPSLNKVAEINTALACAMEEQGAAFGLLLKKYAPNRTTRNR